MPRPKLTPTAEQRRMVKALSACGTPHEKIAKVIGVRSPKTLRKHFREELDLGSTEANYKVAQTLFKMATSGECVAATIFWMKTRNGPSERASDDVRQIAPPHFIVAREPGDPSHDHA